MRVIKVGDLYVGLVDNQSQALRFPDRPVNHANDPHVIDVIAIVSASVPNARPVKLTTLADRTAASMRALADDVTGD